MISVEVEDGALWTDVRSICQVSPGNNVRAGRELFAVEPSVRTTVGETVIGCRDKFRSVAYGINSVPSGKFMEA